MAFVLGGAACAGFILGLAKGPGGLSYVDEVRVALGDLSTPWLLISFLAGSMTRGRPLEGAAAGWLAVTIALLGFYAARALTVDLDDRGYLGDLSHQVFSNRLWFASAVVSGPVFGALGAWWSRRRSPPASMLVGILMVTEGLVWLILVGPQSGGRLHVLVVEVLVGLILVVFAVFRVPRRRHAVDRARRPGSR